MATVSPEALDLLNQVRQRAGLAAYTTVDIPDASTFTDLVIQERAWEFYSEGKRREDLLRQGTFIENAVARGNEAQPYPVLFPLPQSELDANPNLVQNEGC